MELAVKRKHECANIPAFNPFGSNKDEVDVPSFKYWNRLQVFRILRHCSAQVRVDYFNLFITKQKHLKATVFCDVLPDNDSITNQIGFEVCKIYFKRTHCFSYQSILSKIVMPDDNASFIVSNYVYEYCFPLI